MPKGKFVAYYRVSTARQGQSGLGLDAQRKAVADYLNGGWWQLVGEHTETESGKRSDRPELAKALAACRMHKATLIIAKLDRLARNVAFTSNLMESGVDFVAVDFPKANRLTVHILAAVAEHEAEAISTRTKAALAAAKARGKRLGNPENLSAMGRKSGQRASLEARRALAQSRASDVLPAIREAQEAGATSLRQLAAALNARGIPTPRGSVWTAMQIARAMRRAG